MPKLIITKIMNDKIQYLFTKAGNLEWSGIAFFQKNTAVKQDSQQLKQLPAKNPQKNIEPISKKVENGSKDSEKKKDSLGTSSKKNSTDSFNGTSKTKQDSTSTGPSSPNGEVIIQNLNQNLSGQSKENTKSSSNPKPSEDSQQKGQPQQTQSSGPHSKTSALTTSKETKQSPKDNQKGFRNKFKEIQKKRKKTLLPVVVAKASGTSGKTTYKQSHQTQNLRENPNDTFVLVDFIPLDWGSSGASEFDGDTAITALRKIRKERPHLKDCTQGLIHSHHTMGAFFSNTDETELLDRAHTDGLTMSLVVASSATPFAFAISYKDQFGIKHLIETKKITVQYPIEKILTGWQKEWKECKKTKKTWKSYTPNYQNNYKNKGKWIPPHRDKDGVWVNGGYENDQKKKDKQVVFGFHPDNDRFTNDLRNDDPDDWDMYNGKFASDGSFNSDSIVSWDEGFQSNYIIPFYDDYIADVFTDKEFFIMKKHVGFNTTLEEYNALIVKLDKGLLK